MRIALLLSLSASILSMTSCSKKTSKSGGYISPALSEDATPIYSIPTRPDGGLVEGKGIAADPGEAEARRNANMIQPIVFGQSAGGITMTTKYSDAQSILNYYGSNAGLDFYAEHIAVMWSGNEDAVPFVIYVLEGYGNTLNLPAPYGKIAVGKSLSNFIASEADARQLMRVAGATFENQPSTYDCEIALTCQFEIFQGAYILNFRRGGMRITQSAPNALEFIFMIAPQKFYARSTDPIIYETSIAGATFATKKTAFETRYGPGEDNGNGYMIYDRNSLAIRWNATTSQPLTMAANGTYGGTMNFGATIGNRKIGDSFASFAPVGDNGTVFMKNIVQGVLNKPAGYDCTTTTVVTEKCTLTIDNDNGVLFIVVGRSSFVFTNNASRTFLQYLTNATATL